MLEYLFTKTPLVFFTQNLWRDEAYSYLLAEKPWGEILQLSAGDFSPPLYYLLLSIWIKLFGSSEVVLRSLSLIFFAGTLYVLFEILQEVFKISKFKSVFYLLLFVLNPFLTFYAFEARMYMMVTFLITLAYYAFWTNRKRLYVISMVLALLTHYFAACILVIHFLEILYRNYSYVFKLKPFKIQFSKKRGGFSIKQPITIGLLFIPWMIFVILTKDFSDGSFWIIEPPGKDFWYVPFTLFTGYERVFGEYYHEKAGYTSFHTDLLKLLYAILLLPFIIYLFDSIRIKRTKRNGHIIHQLKGSLMHIVLFFKERMLLTSLLLWAFATPYALFFLSFIIQPYYLPRYFIFASVGFILLLIYAFEHLIELKKPSIKTFAGIVLFALLLIMINRFNTWNLKYRSKRTISTMAQEIKAQMDEDDVAYVTSELDYHLYQYYLENPGQVQIYGKTYDEIPQYVGKVLIPEEAIAEQLPIYPSRAFIIYYNWYTTKALY